jgi:hypothetical protein
MRRRTVLRRNRIPSIRHIPAEFPKHLHGSFARFRFAGASKNGPIEMAKAVERAKKAWREVLRELTDPYRPELHYMRGPGPKWAAKHARS